MRTLSKQAESTARLPAGRNVLIAAGLEQALAFLENLQFTAEELDWISGQRAFRPEFVRYLEKLRFGGDVHAMAEGTVFFQTSRFCR